MPQKRQLAAILFADIVGYTALMQKDEALARQNLEKFRNTLNEKVVEHRGQIIQYYGDGCLCIFDSAVDAMRCAKEVQSIFQQEPKVPVRIGLHSGDVFFEADNVFGDAVNITSRVESMGIPGAVLLSSSIRNQIKNKPEFELASLGKFEFKNVEGAMTVYAIANEGFPVPKRENIKGKLKQPPTKKNWLLPALLGGIIVLMAGIWYFQASNNELTLSEEKSNFETPLSEDLRKERLAVIPFNNNTGNPELDNLGVIAADWINKGFMDMEDAEVVSNFTIRMHEESIGIMENDPKGRPSFAELTGAQNLITGSFYQEGNNVIFNLEIVDALQGKLRFSFPVMEGLVKGKEALLEQLRERIIGFWAARNMVESGKIRVPKYKAYELYMSLLQDGLGLRVEEVLALDSNFYLPRIEFINWNISGYTDTNQKHFNFLERHKSNLSYFEHKFLAIQIHRFSGNFSQAWLILKELLSKYPKDAVLKTYAARIAFSNFNNPQMALELYNQLESSNYSPRLIGLGHNKNIYEKVACLIQLSRTKEIQSYLDHAIPNKNANQYRYHLALFLKALANKDENNIKKIYNIRVKNNKLRINENLRFLAGISLSNLSPDWLKKSAKNDFIAFYDNIYQSKHLYSKEQEKILLYSWQNYRAFLEENPSKIQTADLESMPLSLRILNLSLAGRTYIKAGQIEHANQIIQQLINHKTNLSLKQSLTSTKGIKHYSLGQLYTMLGQYDTAIMHLRNARELGVSTEWFYFQFDSLLEPLHDRPDFQELNKPIWPETKN